MATPIQDALAKVVDTRSAYTDYLDANGPDQSQEFIEKRTAMADALAEFESELSNLVAGA